jgi:hypothetical protein
VSSMPVTLLLFMAVLLLHFVIPAACRFML